MIALLPYSTLCSNGLVSREINQKTSDIALRPSASTSEVCSATLKSLVYYCVTNFTELLVALTWLLKEVLFFCLLSLSFHYRHN